MEQSEKSVRIDRVAARAQQEAQLDGRIELEAGQSDIARVIGAAATLIPEEVRVLDDAVEFSGRIVFEVLYVTVDAPDDVAAIEAQSHFDHTIAAPGAKSGMRAEVLGRVDDVEEVLESPRSIALTADVHFDVWVIQTEVIEPLRGASNAQIRTQDHVGVETLENQTRAVDVSEQIEIPPRALSVGQIVSNAAFAVVRDVSATVEGTHVDGDLIVFTNYFSAPDQVRPTPVFQTYSYVIPISADLEWEQRGMGENAQIVLVVDSIDVAGAEDQMGENRLLDVDARVIVSGTLWEERDFAVPTDAYLPGRAYAVETANFRVRKPPVQRRSQRMLRFSVTLPGGYPPMQQTECLRARPTIRSIVHQEDAVLVVGTIECDVIYRSDEEDAPIYGFHAAIPYEERIAVDCDEEDLMVRAWCEQTSCAMIAPNEADCRVQLDVEATCMPTQALEIVTNVRDEGPAQEAQSAIVMTVAGTDDDLWQIAKRFGVSEQEVLCANEQYRTRPPQSGDRVLLYRRLQP